MALLLFHSSFHFWVGPNGSDTAAGAGVSAQLPFATLQRAQQAVRSRPADSAATVTVLPGVYYQDAPLRFGVLDGGSDASRVTWQAAGGGDSVLSFGHAIPAGAAWSQSSANIWTLQLPQVAQGAFYPRQLWRLNDAGRSERLTRARSPDMQIPLDGTLPGEVNRGFRYRDGDLNKYDWSALDELELVVYASWTSGRKYVASLNTSAPFEVRFTAPTGFAPAGMWPNSGNRYYAENAVELVDAPGEWHVSRAGVLTLCSDDAPSGHRFVLDRGDALKEGVLVHGTSDETATLLAGRTSTTKTLPAASTPLGLGSWNLSCVVQTHDAAAAVVRRGPPSGEHVPGDLHLSLVGGAPMVDVGWEGDLHSLTSSGGRQRAVWRESFGVRGGTNVADGQPHALEVRYDGAANTWVLLVDGRVDASATFPFVEKAADDWLLEIAPGAWAADACVANVTLAFCETQPVRNLHFDGLQVQHVGWGLDRALTTQDDFQACSYLDTAALHLVRAQNVSLTGMRVEHVGGIGVWVEGGSGDVQIVRTGVFDVGAGALRVGRGTPLSEEPAEHVTSHVLVNDSRFVNGSRVYSAGNGVLLQRSPFFTLANSEVAYFNHVGVSVGWEWDAKLPPSSQHNTIERNHVRRETFEPLRSLVRPARRTSCWGFVTMAGAPPRQLRPDGPRGHLHPRRAAGHRHPGERGARRAPVLHVRTRDLSG